MQRHVSVLKQDVQTISLLSSRCETRVACIVSFVSVYSFEKKSSFEVCSDITACKLP